MRLSLVAVAVHVQSIAGLRLFESKEHLPANMADECKDALTSDMGCYPRLIKPGEVVHRLPLDTELLDQYCGNACVQSMKVRSALIMMNELKTYKPWIAMGNIGARLLRRRAV